MAQFALLLLPSTPFSPSPFYLALFGVPFWKCRNLQMSYKTCWPKERDLSNGIIKLASSAIYGQSNNSTTSARVKAQFLPLSPSPFRFYCFICKTRYTLPGTAADFQKETPHGSTVNFFIFLFYDHNRFVASNNNAFFCCLIRFLDSLCTLPHWNSARVPS